MTSVPADDNPTGLQVATDALARALVQVWNACDRLPWQQTRTDGTTVAAGSNLAEALSMALALAATELLVAGGESVHQFLAENILTRHRPGCWEADHVRALIYPVELLAPAADQPDGESGG